MNSNGSRSKPKTLSPNILVDFNNATLSLWLDGPQADWTPWNTFADLGSHALNSYSGEETSLTAHMDRVVEKIHRLCGNIYSSEKVPVDLILSGESWTEELQSAFQGRLRNDTKIRSFKIGHVVHQPDLFAATKHAARTERHVLDTSGLCFFGDDEIGHDEF
jgi:hypothetical protein